MPGSSLYLPGDTLSSALGKDQPYEGVWDSTIAMWDAGHANLSSVPADGATLTNLMRDRAASVTGLSLANCDFTISSDMVNGFSAAELTGKKALHVALTQSGSQNAHSGYGASYSQPFAEWLRDNTDAGADYAVMQMLWLRRTRDTLASTAASIAHFTRDSSPSANRLLAARDKTAGVPGVDMGVAGVNLNALAVGDVGVVAICTAGWVGTKPTAMSNVVTRRFFRFGTDGALWGTTFYNQVGSFILYRDQIDLIDLTEVAGADLTAKASAMLAVHNEMRVRDFGLGGRFYNDTYTPAATLKP